MSGILKSRFAIITRRQSLATITSDMWDPMKRRYDEAEEEHRKLVEVKQQSIFSEHAH
jgi:hypothetical protein